MNNENYKKNVLKKALLKHFLKINPSNRNTYLYMEKYEVIHIVKLDYSFNNRMIKFHYFK